MEYSLKRFLLPRVAIVAVVLGLLAPTIGASEEAGNQVAQRETVEQVVPETLDRSVIEQEGEVAVVDLTEVQTIGAFSDYWTCVGMVGGQIAFFVITKQFWRVPPWVWPQVRAACWRFIWS